MAYSELKFRPGVDVESSALATKMGWNASSLIRWRSGWAEAIRGWLHVCNQAVAGVCRALHFWVDLTRNQWYAVGTNLKLYVEGQGTLYDITPTSGFTPGFASTSGLGALLIWSLDNFGQDLIACPSGQGIFLWTPPTVTTPAALITANLTPAVLTGGGVTNAVTPFTGVADGGFIITIDGTVTQVSGLNFAAAATQAQIVAIIQAALGAAVTVAGTVSGSQWVFTLTTVAEGSAATLTVATAPSVGTDISGLLGWSAATVASLSNGGGGANPPPQNQGIFVAMPQQIVVAYGSSPTGGTLDPLLIRWCDQSDFTDWTPSTTNQAGSFRLSRGSKAVGGLQAPGVALIWTDIDVWAMQYIGFPLVFGFLQVGSNCGLIAEKAAAVLGTVVYWMADHGFFRLAGSGAEQIPCSVWDVVYRNLDTTNQDKCLAGPDYHYSEIFFFYPSINGGTGEIDSYAKYNVAENLWDYGPAEPGTPNLMSRTAWTDQNQPGFPISVDLGGKMQEADTGFTADGVPLIGGFIRSGYVDIAEGGQLMSVDQFIPDFQWDGPTPTLTITLYFRNYPGEEPTTLGPFTITPQTQYVTLRLPRAITVGGTTVTAFVPVRAREVALEIDSASQAWWRIGLPRLRQAPAGSLP